jgi:hypothetical protein
MSAVAVRRHFALRHRLADPVASAPATAAWIRKRVDRYSEIAGLASLTVVCDPDRYYELTGRPVDPTMWGDADFPQRLVYVDPLRCATAAAAELVVVHEVAHHRWPSYRHRTVFFARCQQLLDHPGSTARSTYRLLTPHQQH